jgi:subtilisin family serine protease
MTANLVDAAAEALGQGVNAGSSIIELQNDKDLPRLQKELARDVNIEYVSRVPIRYIARRSGRVSNRPGMGIAAVPPSADSMWNLNKIEWRQARALPNIKDAEQIKVAVLDTGIDAAHPDLQGQVSQYRYVHPDLPLTSGERDIIGHGTHVAGTIGALDNNGIGIHGICNCQLIAHKIFDDEPDRWGDIFYYFVEPVMYLRALTECLDLGVNVINLSIGGSGEPDQAEREIFEALIESGTTIVAAMGNERQEGNPISYPAAIPGIIAVGATNIDDSVANFSNRGNHISISAPGVAIWSTLPTYGGQQGFEAVRDPAGSWVQGRAFVREVNYDAWPGTSMATPHVTAAVALLLANQGMGTPASVRERLMETADRVAGMKGDDFHPDYGAGRLNLRRLLA